MALRPTAIPGAGKSTLLKLIAAIVCASTAAAP
jgi:ABC-type polysaccharide/polyol phosphate transport system ATPase subunit